MNKNIIILVILLIVTGYSHSKPIRAYICDICDFDKAKALAEKHTTVVKNCDAQDNSALQMQIDESNRHSSMCHSEKESIFVLNTLSGETFKFITSSVHYNSRSLNSTVYNVKSGELSNNESLFFNQVMDFEQQLMKLYFTPNRMNLKRYISTIPKLKNSQ